MGQSLPFASGDCHDRFAGLAAGGRLRSENIELRFLPVHDLRRDAVSTFFCTPIFMAGESEVVHGYRAFEDLDSRELPMLDCAILEHAVGLARILETSGIVAAIGASVNFETLAWPQGRAMYVDALRHFGAAQNRYLVGKIEEIPSGTPDSRLYDAVLSLRPHMRRVFVHLSERDPRLAGYGHVGASGIVTSLPSRATRPVVMATAKSLQRVCEAQAAISCVDCVESESALDMLRAIGIRFAAGSAFADCGLRIDAPVADIRRLVTRRPERGGRPHSAPVFGHREHGNP